MNKPFGTFIMVALMAFAGWVILRGGKESRPVMQLLSAAQTATANKGLEYPTPTPTETPIPTPTIGYESTSVSAIQTALAAQAVANSAQGTANALEQQHIEATVQSNQLTAQSDKWTAEAPPTSTPDISATATQSSMNLLALNIRSGELTSTAAAPTVLAQIIHTQQDAIIYPVGTAVAMFFLVCFGIFLLRASREKKPIAAPASNLDPATAARLTKLAAGRAYQSAQGIRLTVRERSEDGFVRLSTSLLPCTEKQLTELAERVLNGESLAINKWEGSGTLWNRNIYKAMRRWMIQQGYYRPVDRDMVSLTKQGTEFLTVWLERQSLPRGIEFDPRIAENPMSMAHTHENHAVGEWSAAGETA